MIAMRPIGYGAVKNGCAALPDVQRGGVTGQSRAAQRGRGVKFSRAIGRAAEKQRDLYT